MISTIIMIIIISSSSNGGIIFSFYGFVKLLLMQSLHSCFPRAATDSHKTNTFYRKQHTHTHTTFLYTHTKNSAM